VFLLISESLRSENVFVIFFVTKQRNHLASVLDNDKV